MKQKNVILIRVRAQSRMGTIMSGHKCVWSQTCVGTVVLAQSYMGKYVVEPKKPIYEKNQDYSFSFHLNFAKFFNMQSK